VNVDIYYYLCSRLYVGKFIVKFFIQGNLLGGDVDIQIMCIHIIIYFVHTHIHTSPFLPIINMYCTVQYVRRIFIHLYINVFFLLLSLKGKRERGK